LNKLYLSEYVKLKIFTVFIQGVEIFYLYSIFSMQVKINCTLYMFVGWCKSN